MALTCNIWADADTSAMACAIQNAGVCTPSRTVTCEELMILIADLLNTQLGGAALVEMTSLELEQVVVNARCALDNVAIPPVDRDKLVAVVLYLINEHFCAV